MLSCGFHIQTSERAFVLNIQSAGRASGWSTKAPLDDPHAEFGPRWRARRRLVLLLCSLLLPSCLYAVQPPLHFHGHEYVVTAPNARPRGIIVFLHGLSLDPWIEEQEGIQAFATVAADHGYVVVVPFADRTCTDRQRCWPTTPTGERGDVDAFAAAVPELERLVKRVEHQLGARQLPRSIVGFSNGGFFLAGAVERGLLSGWDRVGIVAGGPLGDPTTTTTALPARGPALFLERFADDAFQGPSMIALQQRWQDKGAAVQLHTQEGGHIWSAAHATTFFDRFVPADTDVPEAGFRR